MSNSIIDTKVAVILNARNEEKTIKKTLENIIHQNLKPYRIIVINDGSTDSTGEIAGNFPEVEIINIEKRKESHLAQKELAATINLGLRKLHEDATCEFVWLVGGDILFSKDYLFTIIQRMKKNPNIVIASGIIKDEFSIEPRGGGRVVSCEFWRKIGFEYPENYGWEGYLIWKAKSLGYTVESFSDLIANSQRQTGKRFDSHRYFYYGLALKALGYTKIYTFGKILLFSRKNFKGSYHLLRGYLSNYDDLYEDKLREFVRKYQNNVILHPNRSLKRFFKIIRS